MHNNPFFPLRSSPQLSPKSEKRVFIYMRKAITPKIRFQVLNRDNFECKYCWLKAGNWIQLQVDHIVSVSEWWWNDIDNLITSCFECNSWKWKTNKTRKENDLYKIKKDIWKWICWSNYSNRLNYTLTELLINNVPFSFLMKFSYFYNEIKNEQN